MRKEVVYLSTEYNKNPQNIVRGLVQGETTLERRGHKPPQIRTVKLQNITGTYFPTQSSSRDGR